MQRALTRARSVLGTTSPNPAVGAVLVREGRSVGEGATQRPGGAHAEVEALRQAGEHAAGATLYVTLEPCSVHGRTPPCTEAIVQAGVEQVVVALPDPDALVDGRGVQQLRDAGIVVSVGDGAQAAERHYEAYSHHRRTGRPFVIAKYAASLDGKIAATSGESRWVSGPQTLAWAHRMRPEIDAILVGVNTVLLDDPQLTARPADRRGPVPQPLRVVLDSRGRTPPAARVLQDQAHARTSIVTTQASDADWRARIEAAGATLHLAEADADGRVALEPLLAYLGASAGVVSLLVEGGGEVHGSFFDAGLVDKLHAVIAPLLIGGDAATAVGGHGAERMIDAPRLTDVNVERLGDDILITGYPTRPAAATEIAVRPAARTDLEAVVALVPPAGRDAELPATVEETLTAAGRGEGSAWIAAAGDAIVGAAAFLPAGGADEEAGSTAQVALLLVQADAGPDVAARLAEAAEASAAGRGFRWLTAPLSPHGLTAARAREDWAGAGYRYYRRSADGGEMLIKELAARSEPGER